MLILRDGRVRQIKFSKKEPVRSKFFGNEIWLKLSFVIQGQLRNAEAKADKTGVGRIDSDFA